jgi:adenine-specific DNA-methyltransferase
MRYLGSKATTVLALSEIIRRHATQGLLCDCFGGTGTVGSFFKRQGFTVWTGDILKFAHSFQLSRVQLSEPPKFLQLLEALQLRSLTDLEALLNRTICHDGWFVHQYSLLRKFFTVENARKIESCRTLITQWTSKGWISEVEHAFLVASLIDNVDRVANTAGTYYAYLKQWQRKSLQEFRFQFLRPTPGPMDCAAYRMEARELVATRFYDVLYLDPPYNSRDYARYYHLPETLAYGDTPPVRGLAGVPDREHQRSDFVSPVRVEAATEELLEGATFGCLIFHYVDTGLLKPEWLRARLSRLGDLTEYVIPTRGYTTSKEVKSTSQRVYVVN